MFFKFLGFRSGQFFHFGGALRSTSNAALVLTLFRANDDASQVQSGAQAKERGSVISPIE